MAKYAKISGILSYVWYTDLGWGKEKEGELKERKERGENSLSQFWEYECVVVRAYIPYILHLYSSFK